MVADLPVVQAVAEALAIPVTGARFTTWFKSGQWDGRHRFLERPSNRFYTGLLDRVRAVLVGLGQPIEEKDERTVPARTITLRAPPMPLRAYQETAFITAERARRGILKVGTGGGKTVIAGHLIARLQTTTLFMVHRKELADQAASEFTSWFGTAHVGRIGDGIWQPERAVVVAMKDTLYARLKRPMPTDVLMFLRSRGLVIVDEAHRTPAESYERILRRCPAYWRFGLSGTPFTKNDVRNWTLVGLLGEQLVDVPAARLVAEGWLARPVCIFLLSAAANGDWERMTYPKAYETLVVHHTARHAMVAQILQRHPDAQVLIVVRRVTPPHDHGRELQTYLATAGMDLPVVSGQDTDEVRATTYRAFRAGTLRRLIASTIYDEGVNFPALDVVVNCAGGWTLTPLFQRLGRAMHRDDPTATVWYYDFLDMGNRHLRRHARARQRELVRAGFEVHSG